MNMPRTVWVLGLVSLLMDLSSELVHSLLPVFMTTVLGAGMLAVGIVEGIAEATASVLKAFSGALSDAGAHLTFFNDAGFGLHLLGHWVRELKIFSLPEGVRRLTSHPAQVFGIRNRGVLKPGNWADLLLFDPAKVGRGAKRRVFALPGGQPRLTCDAVGVHGVWVNGRRPEEMPGRLLREFSA